MLVGKTRGKQGPLGSIPSHMGFSWSLLCAPTATRRQQRPWLGVVVPAWSRKEAGLSGPGPPTTKALPLRGDWGRQREESGTEQATG